MTRSVLLAFLAGAAVVAAAPFARRGARRIHALSATTIKVVRNP